MDKKDNGHPSCEMCELTKKVFGDRFSGCAEFSNHAAQFAVQSLQTFFRPLVDDIDRKFKNGDISRKEFDDISRLLMESLPSAAAAIPAILVSMNMGTAPTMELLVKSYLGQVLKRQLELNPGATIAAIIHESNFLKRMENSLKKEEIRPVSDPKKPSDPNLN